MLTTLGTSPLIKSAVAVAAGVDKSFRTDVPSIAVMLPAGPLISVEMAESARTPSPTDCDDPKSGLAKPSLMSWLLVNVEMSDE